MNNNKHIVNATKTANLIRYAKRAKDKNALVKCWANEMRKAIRLSRNGVVA